MILTASGMHGDMGMKAAKAGKHVIVEKPIDISVKKAKQLIHVCDENNVTLSCIFQHRYDKDTKELIKAVREGRPKIPSAPFLNLTDAIHKSSTSILSCPLVAQ